MTSSGSTTVSKQSVDLRGMDSTCRRFGFPFCSWWRWSCVTGWMGRSLVVPFTLRRFFHSVHYIFRELKHTYTGKKLAKSTINVYTFQDRSSHLLVSMLLQKYCQLPHCNARVLQMQVVNTCMLTLYLKNHTLSVSNKTSNLLTLKASLDNMNESSTNTNEGGERC